jgi:hypothetical protein
MTPIAGSLAAELRHELSWRNREYARRRKLPHCESYGYPPAICYLPFEDRQGHGNFLPESYQAILKHESWRKRLEKRHSQARSCLPRADRAWRELDSSNSSDALLMNIFCYPETLSNRDVFDMLGIELGAIPGFGFRAGVALGEERSDRTEVDMRLGDLLVESKLTEFDFQSAEAAIVEGYRDFAQVFELGSLPKQEGRFSSYQLLRNALAAHQTGCSFCVMLDGRRPDLLEAWYAVMRCVQSVALRIRCKVLTWQELAEALAPPLEEFLEEKYGIVAATISINQRQRERRGWAATW